MAYGAVLAVVGWAMSLFAVAMLFPLLVALGYGETRAAGSFFASALVTLFIGGGLIMATRGDEKTVSRREGFFLAALAWGALPVFGALPIYFSGAAGSVVDAYFEALSGLTTTGATVLQGLDELPRSILFWRALMQWIGGLGAILLAVAILSLLGIGGLSLYRSAIPRGERDTMAGRLRHAVESIWWIYACLTAVCAVLLWLFGMPPFDAVCHAFSALSTGGFSTRDGSVGAFGSPLLEFTLAIFMLIGAINFTLHWAAVNGRVQAYREDPEFKYLIGLVLVVTILVTGALVLSDGTGAFDAVRNALFVAISVVTTSGFLPAEIDAAGTAAGGGLAWPTFLSMLLLILVLVGGCTGSTAGGVKLMRIAILLKQGSRELRRLSYPHGVVALRYGETPIGEPAMRGVWSFFIVFMLSFAGISLGIAACGVDFRTAVAAAAGAVSNAGPAMAYVSGGGSNAYALLPDSAKWWVAVGMLLGRVELFALLTLLNPAFWRR